ncbi:Uncharacterised protein [Chryseobacterium nakagawai]|uniref:Uncharacterized protein n=1 Tax=Chryseobacterium nakagawai TaxID=1241982 RepID=A0AAD0YL90_CHRNA|nr:hypothetical protein [Chryseobacterium nakagawai]AZA91135.1 hypothetical protein EG343_11090 [Chryseobacterium nakagawai]VEH22695.1 Uncharacterised protein [Chryseobacterium nakagawai]
MINPTVKKFFLKNGLSAKALQALSDSVMGSLEENATEEEITDKCKLFEPLAKTFQSEADSRVQAALKKKEQEGNDDDEEEGAGDPEPKPGKSPKKVTTDPLLAAIETLTKTVQGMQTEQVVKTNNQKVIEGLKELKMSEKEIESVMYGRSFEKEEDIEDFVTKQGEYYSEITQGRAEAAAGDGYKPVTSVGNQTAAQKQADMESFNKAF